MPKTEQVRIGAVADLHYTTTSQGSLKALFERACQAVDVLLLGGDLTDVLELPFRKSVVRAALARIAVLCNEHTPHSVSPYGGQDELSVGGDQAAGANSVLSDD